MYYNRLSSFASSLKNILKKKQKKKIVIMHDKDPDGISSGFILSRILENYGYKKDINYFVFPLSRYYFIKYKEEFLELCSNYDIIFYLDTHAPYRLEKKTVFAIDHHGFTEEEKQYNNFHLYGCEIGVNKKPSNSALTYMLYRHLFGKDYFLSFIASIGAVADCLFLYSLKELGIKKGESPFFRGSDPSKVLYDFVSIFWLVKDDDASLELFEKINAAYEKKDLFSLKIIKKEWKEKIMAERYLDSKKVKRLKEIIDVRNKVVFAENTADDTLKEEFYEYVFLNYPGKVAVSLTDRGDLYSISMRTSPYNGLEIMKKISHSLNSLQFGGHPYALGGRISKEEKDLFKDLLENVLEALGDDKRRKHSKNIF